MTPAHMNSPEVKEMFQALENYANETLLKYEDFSNEVLLAMVQKFVEQYGKDGDEMYAAIQTNMEHSKDIKERIQFIRSALYTLSQPFGYRDLKPELEDYIGKVPALPKGSKR